jgi:two-component system sensor histidine kinase RpfC
MPTNILVVDDHPLYRESFCSLLQECFADLQLVAVEDGSQALSLTHQIPFDLLILDYHLPGISGGDVVRYLRSRARTTARLVPPIILMSAHPDIAVFARSLGVVAVLHKPVELNEIHTVIGPILEQSPARKLGLSLPFGSNPVR